MNKDTSNIRLVVKILLTGFCLSLLVNVILGYKFSIHKSHENFKKEYPLIDLARHYIPQQHFVVNVQPLREKINAIVKEEGEDKVTVYFEFLNTGANIQINKDLHIYPASLMKTPAAMAIMRKKEEGLLDLNDTIALRAVDKDPTFGTMYKSPVGTQFSYEQLLEAALVKSDNTAYNMLLRNLTQTELIELKDDLGLEDLVDKNYLISVKEYSRLFRSLYSSSFINRINSQYILTLLSQTSFNGYLEKGLSEGILFSHKIGEDSVGKNFIDVGIVYLEDRPYLIGVGTTSYEREKAQKIMRNISNEIFEYIRTYE